MFQFALLQLFMPCMVLPYNYLHVLNGYEIYFNITNYPLFNNMQDFRNRLCSSICIIVVRRYLRLGMNSQYYRSIHWTVTYKNTNNACMDMLSAACPSWLQYIYRNNINEHYSHLLFNCWYIMWKCNLTMLFIKASFFCHK